MIILFSPLPPQKEEDCRIPIDNSATERAIRPFTVGRANGAEASVMIYKIAKANQPRIYEYLKHLLTKIPKHMNSSELSFGG